MKMNKVFISLFFSFFVFFSFAQEGVKTPAPPKKEISGKIMVVPFEPKLYMSEFDQKFNAESKWNFNQIREYFRHQLSNYIKQKFQTVSSPVVCFYTDSIKTAKDLDYIYKSTAVSFDLIDKPTSPTTNNKKESGIKNGQIVVEISNDKKFTNIKTQNPDLIPYLSKKYKSEYFVFINELDFNTVPGSYNPTTETYEREVVVHYTIIDKNSKLIIAGAATSKFTSKENNPKKVAALVFPPIAAYIVAKFNEVTKPEPAKK